MNESLAMLGFMSVFHIIGGAAIGATVRGMMDRSAGKGIGRRVPFLIWGVGFGCMPLVFGLQEGARFLAVQIVILSIAFAITFFWMDTLRDIMRNPDLARISVGGLFLLIGLVAGYLVLRSGDFLFAVLAGGAFIIIGGAVFIGGMRAALGADDEDE